MQKSFIGIVENDKGIDGQKMPLKAIVCRRENENSSITTGAFGVEKSACASRVLFLRADGNRRFSDADSIKESFAFLHMR